MKPVNDEMRELYSQHVDPWNYEKRSRHWITAGLVKTFWNGGDLLEVGCGEGILTRRILDKASFHGRYTACDLDPEAVKRASSLGLPTTVHCFDITKDFPAGRYEVVLISDVLPYFEVGIRDKVFATAWTRVKPCGYLIVTDWIDWCTTKEPYVIPEDGKEVCKMRWEGEAMDLKEQVYMSAASYNVIQKS